MNSSETSSGPKVPADNGVIIMRLYIAGGATNSLEAMDNLKRICEEYSPHNHQVDIIDILQEPRCAVSDGVFVTPTLVKVAPAPTRQFVGTLTEKATVLLALGLKESQK